MKNYYLRNRLCFPVKGINRGIIYDLSRQDYFFIPLDLYEKINKEDIIIFENDTSIKAWEELLLEKEIIFLVDNKTEDKFFPQISQKYETPSLVSNLVIHDSFDIEKINILESLYILNVSVIIKNYESIKNQEFVELITRLSALEIDSIYIYLNDENKLFKREDFNKLHGIEQLFNIYIFNNSINRDDSLDILNFISSEETFEDFSKVMTKDKLQVNYPHFFEALIYNNYFNKKLYIDEIGNIKNGVNNTKSFGNINQMNKSELLKTIVSDSFTALWNVKKENTLVCKDCEFRYMCVDPRVPEKNNEGEWFHQLECNYNPYLSTWSHEEQYKTLEECGIIIDQEGILNINKGELNQVFNSVWEQ